MIMRISVVFVEFLPGQNCLKPSAFLDKKYYFILTALCYCSDGWLLLV